VAEAGSRETRWQLRTTERRMLLIVGDLLAGIMATMGALALWSRFDYLTLSEEFVRARAGWFVLLPIIWLLLLINSYDVRRSANWAETVRNVLMAATFGTILYLSIYFFRTAPGSLPRRGPFYFLVLAVGLTMVWRYIYVRIFTSPAFLRRVLIVGAGSSGVELLKILQGLNPSPFYVVGMIDDDENKHGMVLDGIKVLGSSAKIESIIREEDVSDIVVAILGQMNGEMFQALLDAQERYVEIIRMPVLYEELLGRVPIHHLESDWLLRSFVDEVRVSSLYLLAKRVLDLLFAIVGLILLGLVFPWVSLAILIESGRPILYTQTRLGQGGRVYELVKFRTMMQDAESDGVAHWTDEGDPRMTRLGRLLRKVHIDEFPQFINVLKGDMSMVGPRPERPELVKNLERQIPFYRARLLAKPGIGGWAQVNYGKGGSVEGSAEKLEYDLYYIKHRSFFLDIWIILRSIGAALGFRGV
jgi:exopolysaccharide biosynthesis polyprenyl glycosylphosphotransferase